MKTNVNNFKKTLIKITNNYKKKMKKFQNNNNI